MLAVVVGQCGAPRSPAHRRSSFFSSNISTINDDNHQSLSEDLDNIFYREIAELYSGPTDWILSINTMSG